MRPQISLEFSFDSKAAEIIACAPKSTYDPGLFTNPSTVNKIVNLFDRGVFFLFACPPSFLRKNPFKG
jgi:hypothetical protein